MNLGGLSEHQSKTSDTNRYERFLLTARVSQVKMNTMKKIFEQRSELQVAKCLIVHVLSSNYNVFLSFEIKVKQRSKGAFVSPFILYPIMSVYIMRECMRTMSKANSVL